MECAGVRALGACDLEAKFVVRVGTGLHARNRGACGVHLAQVVKNALRTTRCVEVEKAHD